MVETEVLNRQFNCPFCSCFFFTEHDLALHLKAFNDKGEAHRECVRRFHAFVEDVGSECLSEDFCQVEFLYPEQELAKLVYELKVFFGLPLVERSKFRSSAHAKSE